MKQPVSNCCGALLITNSSDEGTGYYSCERCKKDCDPVTETKEQWWLEKADGIVYHVSPIKKEVIYSAIHELVDEAYSRGKVEGLEEVDKLVGNTKEKYLLGFDAKTSPDVLFDEIRQEIYQFIQEAKNV